MLGLGLPYQKIYLPPTTFQIVVYTHVSVNDLVIEVIENSLLIYSSSIANKTYIYNFRVANRTYFL